METTAVQLGKTSVNFHNQILDFGLGEWESIKVEMLLYDLQRLQYDSIHVKEDIKLEKGYNSYTLGDSYYTELVVHTRLTNDKDYCRYNAC